MKHYFFAILFLDLFCRKIFIWELPKSETPLHIPFVSVYTQFLCPSLCETSWEYCSFLYVRIYLLRWCAPLKVKHISWASLACWCIFFSSLIFFFRTHIIFFLPFCAQLPWNVVKVVSLIRTPAKKLIKTTKF